MATPGQNVASKLQRPAQGPKGSEACLGPLDNLECEETQELMLTRLAMQRKAQEFFQTCDAGGKGFIARRDMQVRGAPDGPAYLECQTAWVLFVSQFKTSPVEVTSLTEKMPSTRP